MSNFNVDIDKWIDKAERNMHTVGLKSLSWLAEALVVKTPVGMPELWVRHRAPPGYVPGTARAGWHIGRGGPVYALPVAPDADGRATIAAMRAQIGRDGGRYAKIGGIYSFSNNVPYIEELERGYSHQSPPNAMVLQTVIEFRTKVDEFAREVNQ